MARTYPTIRDFSGGLSAGLKTGLAGSFFYGRHLDIHSDPSSVKILPKTTKSSGSTVTGLVIDMARQPNGDAYFLDQSKVLTKMTSAGTWSSIGTISSDTNGMGLFYWAAKDTIYATTDQSISTYGRLASSPSLTSGKYGNFVDQKLDVVGSSTVDLYQQSANIQGMWHMDESSGSRSDSSGNGNTLTDNNTVASSTTKQEGLRSADFERDNSEYLSITDGSQTGLDLTSNFTIAFWYRPESVGAVVHGLVSKWTGASQRSYIVTKNASNQIQFNITSDGASAEDSVSSTGTLSAGTWYYITCVYEASTRMEVYINGASDTTNTTTIESAVFNSTGAFLIGADAGSGSPGNFADGLIDDVVVWNRALTDTEVDDQYDAYGDTYDVGTSVSESADAIFELTPEFDPQVNVVVPITAKGTGNWTVTVHDDANNTIATKTIANASLTNSADNTFTFDSNWRPVLGATYHLHITSTVADGTMTPGTDVMDTTAARLVDPRSGAHPILEFTTFLAIANERYLATYDGLIDAALDSDGTATSSWDPHRLTLPSGYEIVSLAKYEENIVMGCEYRGDNTDDFSQGLLVFWDGISDLPNFTVDIPEGGVQAMLARKNRLYFIAGLRGELFVYGGGQYVKLKRFPNTTNTNYVRSSWACATNYQGMPLFGLGIATDNSSFEHGAYSWGATDETLPDVLNYGYSISSGTRTGTTVSIGMVQAYGTDLFIGWKDGSTYGVDIVNPSAAPFSTAVLETRALDNGENYRNKPLLAIKAIHAPLATGQSINLGYKRLGESSYTTKNTANSTVGSLETKFDVSMKESKYFQVQLTMGATTTTPQVFELVPEYDSAEADEIV